MTATDEVTALLEDHPWVDSARWDAGRTAIAVRPTAAAVAVRPTPGPLLAEHLRHWQQVYEFVYTTAADRHGADLDLSGWRASDSGEPFPREHMLEWIDHAVGLVLRGKPRLVLEIGCGSGLLAHRIHRHTRGYVGLDVAAPVVARLREQHLPGVRVLQAAAHDLTSTTVAAELRAADTGLPTPDCIVLNSVTQCFPHRDYLTAVLDDALDLVAPGGTVVVGDIRNLANARHFARWLESARDPGLCGPELDARVTRRLAADEELLCDPRVFGRIAHGHHRDVRTCVYAKPFHANTELTRYRYDIVYTVDASTPPQQRTRSWTDLSGTLEQRLAAVAEGTARVTGIPNALLDTAAPDGATPAQLVAAAPDGWAVLLDCAVGARLAVGAPEYDLTPEYLSDTASPPCNDPFARFVRQRLPEVLTDYLDRRRPGSPTPPITVAQEPNAS